jgi:hypothetical protein
VFFHVNLRGEKGKNQVSTSFDRNISRDILFVTFLLVFYPLSQVTASIDLGGYLICDAWE